MRGIYNSVTDIRRNVFTEIARLAYEGGDYASSIEKLPFKIIPGERATYRDSIFLERAIVGERLRLGIGLPVRRMDEHSSLSDGIEESAIAEKYYDDPLVNVIKFACNACPEKTVVVTDTCQGCLAHPCKEVCPKDAISMVNGKSYIDQEKCIKCGRCMDVCPYGAINKLERPCARSCGMDAITSDELGRAEIDYDKCVSCGMCLVNCPFGAIVDKGQIFQTIHAMKSGKEVIAAIAPAFVGQFGPTVTPEKVKGALKELGFADVIEVAIGADLCTVEEAEDFLSKVPAEQPFMATSCCPAWSVMAKKVYPKHANCISMALTPMTLTARLIKKQHESAKVVFIGPCAAKKLEAMRTSIRSDVDFVLTFEEMAGIFDAKHVDIENIEEDPNGVNDASTDGRNFAVAGGVATSVKDVLKELRPDMEVKIANAEGLKECRQLLKLATLGKYDGYLLEGMACPGGCVAGAGTMQPVKKSQAAVNIYASKANHKNCHETEYVKELDKSVE